MRAQSSARCPLSINCSYPLALRRPQSKPAHRSNPATSSNHGEGSCQAQGRSQAQACCQGQGSSQAQEGGARLQRGAARAWAAGAVVEAGGRARPRLFRAVARFTRCIWTLECSFCARPGTARSTVAGAVHFASPARHRRFCAASRNRHGRRRRSSFRAGEDIRTVQQGLLHPAGLNNNCAAAAAADQSGAQGRGRCCCAQGKDSTGQACCRKEPCKEGRRCVTGKGTQ